MLASDERLDWAVKFRAGHEPVLCFEDVVIAWGACQYHEEESRRPGFQTNVKSDHGNKDSGNTIIPDP